MSDPSSSSASSSTPPPPPPPPSQINRPKSPPLAFEKSPNDSLVPPHQPSTVATDGELPVSPTQSIAAAMGRLSPLTESPLDLQAIIDKQASVIKQLHKAFATERESWDLERQRFVNRIYSLEELLKNGEHHSPAKSPILTPNNGPDVLSPRAIHPAHMLPTITEDENTGPLSNRREGAPQSIGLPPLDELAVDEHRRGRLVSFTNDEGLQVVEIPILGQQGLSPPPPANRMLAGHTPIKVPRRPTPPPANMSMDGIEDMPTRNNTHINTMLTRSSDDEEDIPLRGPLNMPELPHKADATNFTLDALTQKLQQIEKHPERSKPTVYSRPTPGVASPASPAEPADVAKDSTSATNVDTPFSPVNTRVQESAKQIPGFGSHLSPSVSKTPDGVLSPQEIHEANVQKRFEEGGIRLKKKTSTNFGAPFGSLAGFPRKTSHDH